MSDSTIKLPATDAYVHLHLLNGGSMTAEYHKLHAGDPADEFRLYNWAFFIHHEKHGRRIVWDLGLSSTPDDYPPAISSTVMKEARFHGPHEPLTEQIQRRTRTPADAIDTVLISHPHFDHCRPISPIFPNAIVYFGPGTVEHCAPGHFADPASIWDGRFFDPEQATERWETLQGPWRRFGPFERAMDFFGDGSFWIIQAPGHMPGNLCACARLATGKLVLLGSDCCHSRALLDGTKDFGTFQLPDGSMCQLHTDISAARDTLARIRVLERELGFHIALAHDAGWMESEDNPVLLSLLDEKFRHDMRNALGRQEPF
ncbi:beta-lactamase-like protein [Aspergillus californicus]